MSQSRPKSGLAELLRPRLMAVLDSFPHGLDEIQCASASTQRLVVDPTSVLAAAISRRA